MSALCFTDKLVSRHFLKYVRRLAFSLFGSMVLTRCTCLLAVPSLDAELAALVLDSKQGDLDGTIDTLLEMGGT